MLVQEKASPAPTVRGGPRDDRLAAAYVLVLAFGLRRAELLGLAWADLDLSAGLLAVRQQVTVHKSPQAADGKRAARGVLELSALKTGSGLPPGRRGRRGGSFSRRRPGHPLNRAVSPTPSQRWHSEPGSGAGTCTKRDMRPRSCWPWGPSWRSCRGFSGIPP